MEENQDVQEAIAEANKPCIEIIDYSERAIAVIGDTIPIKGELKELGGKFNPRLSCGAGWIFSKKILDKVQGLLVGYTSASTSILSAIDEKNLIAEYIEEIKNIYPTDRTMLDYFRKNVSVVVKLSNGMYIPFEKPKIKTDFWVSEGSTRTMDEALRLCNDITTSEQAFIDANTREMRDRIKELEGNVRFCLKRKYSARNGVEIPIVGYHYLRDAGFHSGEEMTLSQEDRKLIIDAEKREFGKFERRIKTYLKRYGLSKVSANTYWADR